jgi:hypothetical protein
MRGVVKKVGLWDGSRASGEGAFESAYPIDVLAAPAFKHEAKRFMRWRERQKRS